MLNKKHIATCPICKAASEAAYHPFCSSRCAQIDLGRWFGESYAIPSVEPPDEYEQQEWSQPSNHEQ